MAEKKQHNKLATRVAAWAVLAAGVLPFLASPAAQADHDGCNLAGAPARTLRNPLIPGAPYTPPGAAPWQGQPVAPGSGPVPAGVHPGDWGGPPGVRSGAADPTHGNMFPPAGSPGPKGPWNYVPGAGRRYTTGGSQQGMFEFGQGNGGQGTYEPGYGNGGQGMYEPGYGNGGQGTYEGGAGNGGQGTFEGGAGNGGAGTFEPGAGNGGAGTFESGAGNGGQGTSESGAGNGGSRTNESGAGNGGVIFYDFGSGSSGTQSSGGGKSSGRGVFNNGGPRNDAVPEQDRLFAHSTQGNKYEFQGPLPTVRTFSRYLVILGVVAATIFVAIASISVVLGSPYGTSRVIGAVGGLLLLLAGYTIWKIVQMNTFNFNSTDTWSMTRNGQRQDHPQRGGATPPGPFSPENPGGGGGAPPGGGGGGAPPGGGSPPGGFAPENPNG